MWILLGFIAFFICTGLAYVIFTLMFVPGLAEERLGRLEDLPQDDGEWREDARSPKAEQAKQQGTRRETRYWIDRDWFGRERILLQARYLNASGDVVATDPDVRVKRRRIKS
jgi:hypothetical protein